MYILKIEVICLPPMCNTITPIIGYRHVLMRVYLTPPGRKSNRWINVSHFDERTRNTMREWIHASEEVQLWILVDAEEAEYLAIQMIGRTMKEKN